MAMQEGKNRIKESSAARDALEDEAHRLCAKATAAAELGFESLAQDLWVIAASIRKQTEILFGCWKHEFHAHCDSVQQGSTNMLAGMLAACELHKKSEG